MISVYAQVAEIINFQEDFMGKKGKLYEYEGLFYILPWIIGFCLFQFYPFITSFFYSFTNYSILGGSKWIALQNYKRLFTFDPDFKKSIAVTLQYACISVPGKMVFALFVAMLLNKKVKGVNIFRTLYYMPSILGGSVAIASLWKLMFMRDGMINHFLGLIRIPPVNWLGSTHIAIITLSLLQVWQFGSSMVLFLAALKQIPAAYYESASLDGANKFQQFTHITFPMITPIVFFNLIMQMINAIQNFTSAFVITNGGPLKSTYLIGMKLYTEGFNNFKMGYASAISWVMFSIILVFTLLVFKSSKAWVYYQDGGRF
jgi:oligogalacturonide transport system permease protein